MKTEFKRKSKSFVPINHAITIQHVYRFILEMFAWDSHRVTHYWISIT